VSRLQTAEITARLRDVPEWKKRGATLRRGYAFADFLAAMKFVNAVARAAEKANHHPDIAIVWNRVTLTLTTHDAGGLTDKDFALAARCDVLAAGNKRR
jgi:4a-hydroxytetrahydrobiopterin dehydratase